MILTLRTFFKLLGISLSIVIMGFFQMNLDHYSFFSITIFHQIFSWGVSGVVAYCWYSVFITFINFLSKIGKKIEDIENVDPVYKIYFSNRYKTEGERKPILVTIPNYEEQLPKVLENCMPVVLINKKNFEVEYLDKFDIRKIKKIGYMDHKEKPNKIITPKYSNLVKTVPEIDI